MAITLTKYIYPLKEKVLLSKHLDYYIDNPRTEEEVQFVKDYVSPALKRYYESSMPNYNPMLSAAFAIRNWRDYVKDRDEYVYEYLNSNRTTHTDDIVSQSWVIIRYKDNGEFDRAKNDKNVFFDIFFSDARHAYLDKYNTLLSYCHLVSLLCHSDEDRYIGDSFVLLKKPQDIFYPVDNTHAIIEAFRTFHGTCGIASDNRFKTWNYFPDVCNDLIGVCNSLVTPFENLSDRIATSKKKKQSSKDKLSFIGDLLRVVENETQDVKVKLLLLVSIMEFMVTRNPDTNKFNVEDSISKQFILKASVIIYNNNRDVNLAALKENLKLIYSQRSDVAHGNYISKEDNDKMVESFYELYNYIRAIVIEYIKDAKFVDFLKEN